MRILHVDSSILAENSVSRRLSAAIVAKLLEAAPDASVVYRDVVAEPIVHLSGRSLAGQNADVQHDQALQTDLDLGGRALAEFLDADTVVIGAPMYNFTVPSQLKSWIDRITVSGKTFRYTAAGAEGLAGGKRVLLALSQGGFYGPGMPHERANHQEPFLRTVFGFLGITDVRTIDAPGLAIGPEQREASIAAALEAVAAL